MDLNVISDNFQFMMEGLSLTFQLAFLSIAGGLFLGVVLAAARLSSKKWLYAPAAIYVHFFRGLPIILVIFWIYFLFPVITGKTLGAFFSSVVSFIVFEAAYFAEIVRAGIQSIKKGQSMAALSTGMTSGQTLLHVILPQALRNMSPGLVNQSVIILQDTSLTYVVGLKDFLRRVNLVDARESRSVELYLFAGLVYFLICTAGSLASHRLEKRREGSF